MSLFDFMSDGVEQALNTMAQQIQRAEAVAADLRNGVAPLENGGWIGEGAEAFFEDTRAMLAHLDQTHDQMQAFTNALNQAMQMVQQAMQAINGITNG